MCLDVSVSLICEKINARAGTLIGRKKRGCVFDDNTKGEKKEERGVCTYYVCMYVCMYVCFCGDIETGVTCTRGGK